MSKKRTQKLGKADRRGVRAIIAECGGGEESGRHRVVALIALRGTAGASALDIGNAFRRGRGRSIAQRERLGLAIAAKLVRDGVVRATPGNCFVLLPKPECDERS